MNTEPSPCGDPSASGPSPRDAGRFDAVPADLRERAQWVVWRLERTKKGTSTKVPYQSLEPARKASTTSPVTWSTFEEAVSALRRDGRLSGIGFVFSEENPYAGVDLDRCIDEHGVIAAEAQAIIDRLASYSEVSPSGRGVKVIVRGSLPAGARHKTSKVEGYGAFEVYDTLRFFTVTGNRLPSAPAEIREAGETLLEVHKEVFGAPVSTRNPTTDVARGFSGDDEALIQLARAAANGNKFTALFDRGDTSEHGGDDSSADAALASILAFWCGPDPARVERLFDGSALGQREKWRDREDYRARTIRFAIDSCTEFYSPRRTPPRQTAPGSGGGARRTPRPEIVLTTEEHHVIDQVVSALESDPEIYQRGGRLVEVIEPTAPPLDTSGGPAIAPIELPRLREIITRNSGLLKLKDDELVAAHPPPWLVAGVAARGSWAGLRPLSMISRAPVLRSDGTVWQTPGYDGPTGVLYMPNAEYPEILAEPTHDQASRACDSLLEVVSDFPFASHADTAAYLAALLTPVARPAYRGPTPLVLFDANTRGVGKTLAAQVIGHIVLGHDIPASSYVHDSAEMRKQITTTALCGDSLVLLDNLNGVIGNDALDRALTSVFWRDRRLGSNQQVAESLLTVWFATGNNVAAAADTARRCLHIRFDSPEENPEDRSEFKHPNLLVYVDEQRPRLYMDAVMILRAYIAAGRPDMGIRPFGSFEGWSALVRGAVRWLGLPDPCSTREDLEVFADTGRESLAALLTAWYGFEPGGKGLLLGELLKRLYPPDGSQLMAAETQALRLAIEGIVPAQGGRMPDSRKLGNKLRSFRRRVIDGLMLDCESERKAGGMKWRVVRREAARD